MSNSPVLGRSWAYYNDSDPFCAQWLRNLISAGLIAPGEVDERSINDVRASDLAGFNQCHFFAGIGGWSLALRLAGWADDRPVWSGSCPCQPFSVAGKRKGASDERHLWPEFARLIGQCQPPVCFGEQTASKLGRQWLAGVRADLEELGYGVGAADLCAAGVGEEVWTQIIPEDGSIEWEGLLKSGPPHIRQRLWWVAQSNDSQRGPDLAGRDQLNGRDAQWPQADRQPGKRGEFGRLPDSQSDRSRQEHPDARRGAERDQPQGWPAGPSVRGTVDRLSDTFREGLEGWEIEPVRQECPSTERSGVADGLGYPEHPERGTEHQVDPDSYGRLGPGRSSVLGGLDNPPEPRCAGDRLVGPVAPPWNQARLQESPGRMPPNGTGRVDWSEFAVVDCLDGRTRRIPVEPEFFPLAHGISNRLGKLRGYGNSIVPQTAAVFIQAFQEAQITTTITDLDEAVLGEE